METEKHISPTEDKLTEPVLPKVFLLAGGLGKRLRPLVNNVPKPMAPIHGRPFLEYQLHLLSRHGFRHFVLCVGYMATRIIEYFGDGSRRGFRVEYSVEETPMGTGGALRCAAGHIDPEMPFLVINGDTYFDVDLRSIVAGHGRKRSQKNAPSTRLRRTQSSRSGQRPSARLRRAQSSRSGQRPSTSSGQRLVGTVVLTHSPDKHRYGSVVLDEKSGRILSFAEKAQSGERNVGATLATAQKDTSRSLVSAGIYVLEPDVLQYIPSDRPVSIEREVFPRLATLNVLYGLPVEGQFVDIGTPEGYLYLSRHLAPLPTAPDRQART
jgi:NDP-sugar pyrophosphorylase family protein